MIYQDNKINSNNSYSLRESVFSNVSVNILGFDIHLDSPFEVPSNKESFRALEEDGRLIVTTRQHKNLKYIALIFPIIYATTAILEQYNDFFCRHLEEWKISVSFLIAQLRVTQLQYTS